MTKLPLKTHRYETESNTVECVIKCLTLQNHSEMSDEPRKREEVTVGWRPQEETV